MYFIPRNNRVKSNLGQIYLRPYLIQGGILRRDRDCHLLFRLEHRLDFRTTGQSGGSIGIGGRIIILKSTARQRANSSRIHRYIRQDISGLRRDRENRFTIICHLGTRGYRTGYGSLIRIRRAIIQCHLERRKIRGGT